MQSHESVTMCSGCKQNWLAQRTTNMWSERKCAGALSQSAKCATVPIRNLCHVKALITSACLKHSGVTKLDNWIETSPTAVHMNPSQ